MSATEDLFTPVHKGLRSMLYDLSARLQTNDFGDTATTADVVALLETDFGVARSAGCVLCTLHRHAEDEEVSIFPSTAPHDNRLITELIAEHQELTRQELSITGAAHELLRVSDPEARSRAGVQLNQRANDLFGAYLAHMNREERELVPLMRERFTDPQLAAMRGAIIGRMPRDRLLALLGWILPSLNRSELRDLLRVFRQNAPPELVTAVVGICDTRIDPARWAATRSEVGL